MMLLSGPKVMTAMPKMEMTAPNSSLQDNGSFSAKYIVTDTTMGMSAMMTDAKEGETCCKPKSSPIK